MAAGSLAGMATRRLPVVAGAVLGVLTLGRAWVSDDAYITFRTVSNFIHGYGPVYNVGERVQAYTHPLWFLLLSVLSRLGIDLYYASILLGVVCAIGVGYLIAKTLPPASAIIVVAALATSPSFLDFSTSGLENSLSHLLIAGMIALAFGWEEMPERRRALLIATCATLCILNRFDDALLVGPALLVTLISRPRPAIALVLLVLWLAFATVYYGTPLPNTFYAKLGAMPLGEGLRHGIAYLSDYALAEPLHAGIAALGALLAFHEARGTTGWPTELNKERRMLLALTVGVLLYVAYIIVIGGDFMRGRMFTGPLLVAVAVGGITQAARGPALGASATAMIGALFAVFLLANTTQYDNRVSPAGIGNERAIYQTLWLSTRTARTSPEITTGIDAPTLGLILRRYSDLYGPVTVSGTATGQYGYLAGPQVTVLDTFGLSDAFVARMPAQPHPRPGYIARAVPLDYFRNRGDLTLQKNYVERLRALDPTLREDALKDAKARPWSEGSALTIWNRVELVASGPLLSQDRLRTVSAYAFSRPNRPDEGAVRATNGDMAVRANYQPTFGQFGSVIGVNTGRLPDGTDWNDDRGAVELHDTESWVTIDLGGSHSLSEISLQGDANDIYIVTFSTDGKRFTEPWAAPASKDVGLRTRVTPQDFERTARYVRIQEFGGDNLYSLGRVDVLTEQGRLKRLPTAPVIEADAAVKGDGQAVVTWKPTLDDGGSRVARYIVRAEPGNIEVSTADATTLKATVTGLENGTSYTFTVRAVNEVGEGPPSTRTNAITPELTIVASRGKVTVRANYTPRSGKFSALLTDPIPPEGLPYFDAERAVALPDPNSWVILDLGENTTITKVTLQADNNDNYVLTFSADGKQFSDPQIYNEVAQPGLRTRETPNGFTRSARYVKVQGSRGDSSYALGAMEVFGPNNAPLIRR